MPIRIPASFLWFSLLTIALVLAPLPGQTREEDTPAAFIVRVEGTSIDTPTIALIERGIRTVKSESAQYLILDISSTATEPEDLARAAEVLNSLKDEQVATVAFIEEHCFPAATMLALGCDQVFIRANGARISGTTVVEADFARMSELMVAALVGTPRDNPKSRLLVQAMVDREKHVFEVVYKDASGIEQDAVVTEERLEEMRQDATIEFSVEPTKLVPQPLSLEPADAERLGLVNGVHESLEDMTRDQLALDPSLVAHLDPSWSEGMVTWLNGMRQVLFVIGFILLLIEVKTPGFALPGVLGVIFFGMAFFGAYMVGLADITEILLFFLGIALLAIEIWVLPGMVVFGLLGFLCMVAGLIFSQQTFYFPANDAESAVLVNNLTNFGLVLVGVMLGIWAVYANMHRIPILKWAVQTPPERHEAGERILADHEAQLAALAGQVGTLATDLRPAGVMAIGHERYDVVSQGSFVDQGAQVRVIEVRGNRIVVEPVEDENGPESGEASIAMLAFLVLLGLALIVAEVFFVSFGILAIVSGTVLVFAVFLAFTEHGAATGYTLLVTCAVLVPATIKLALLLLPNTALGRQFYLAGNSHEEVTGGAQEEGLEQLLNQRGVAVMDLRPSGFAEIGERRIDVVTRGEVIDKGSPVRVIKIELNQVIVAQDEA